MSLRLSIILIAVASLLVSVSLAFAIAGLRPESAKSADSAAVQTTETVPVKLAPGEKRTLFSELGMSCISCRAAVASALDKVKGVKTYSIDSEKDLVIVTYKKAETSPKAIKEAIIDGGYKVGGIKELD